MAAEYARIDLDRQQNWLLSVLFFLSTLGLGRRICHHADVDSKTICNNKVCDRDVGHHMATFCYTGVAGAKAMGSDLNQQQTWLLSAPSSQSTLGLGRRVCHHADVDSKTICTPKKKVTVTLGIRWQLCYCKRGLFSKSAKQRSCGRCPI